MESDGFTVYRKNTVRIKMIFSAAVMEILLALASFTACLHYDDVVERLQLYNKLQHLAEIYPGAYKL